MDTHVRVEPLKLAGQPYAVDDGVETTLDVSRTVSGYALRLRFAASVTGACMRCVEAATPVISVDAREVDQPGDAEELHSPYVDGGLLDLAAWARDALVLAMPAQILCREDCEGLCAVCGERLEGADPLIERAAPAKPVDRPPPGRDGQPGGGHAGHAVARPGGQRDGVGVLQRVLGEREVAAEMADERRQDARAVLAGGPLERAGGRQSKTTTGRTSTDP
jgi:uncharacterized protein